MTTAYSRIDRFLRENLNDNDYPAYKEELDALCQAKLQRSESSGKPAAWVWLTIEQVHECWEKLPPYFNEKDFAKIVEAKCKELNTCPSDNSDADTINIFYIEKGDNGH